jgi:hypothetical protein
MTKRTIVAFLLLAGSLFTFEGAQTGSSLRAAAQEKPAPAKQPRVLLDCSIIDPLDGYIQDRFIQRGRGFGLERVMTKGPHTPISSVHFSSQPNTIGMFFPENDQEREAVAEIEQSNLKMVLYLASRNVLGTRPVGSQNRNLLLFHAPLRGPVAITQDSQNADWPEALSLWKQAQEAMQDFDRKKSVSEREFSVGDKDFIARPVRAQESCLKCHAPQTYQSIVPNNDGAVRQLSVGDPIGVLLYAYTKSVKSNNPNSP